MSKAILETDETTQFLLKLSASDDVAAFRQLIEQGFTSNINIVGQWHDLSNGSKQSVTPLMVASTHGSTEVVKFILSFPNADVNKSCGIEKATALHCAASGGSPNSVEVVKLLLEAGADPNLADANGDFPVDVISVPENDPHLKTSQQELLSISKVATFSNSNLKEYPIDPNFPGVTSEIYKTEEFRMYCFKVKPCSRGYPHDWMDCPFVHPGESARRRDPRKYHYSSNQCQDYNREGGCRKGDMCENAHGSFESWLHPAQYRTRICKEGASCNRRVCFFAHNQNELRPLHAPPTAPRSESGGMEFGSGMCVFTDSPSSLPFTPPTSPTTISVIAKWNWAIQKVPSLHLPGGNFPSSPLRWSPNGMDFDFDLNAEELEELADFEMEHMNYLNEIARLAQPPSLGDTFPAANSPSPRPLFSPAHNQFHHHHHQHRKMLPPVNAGFSPLAGPSSGRNSPHGVGPISPQRAGPVSPMAPRVPILPAMRGLSPLGSSSAAIGGQRGELWINFGGKPSGGAVSNANDLEELDFEWVNSLVKDTPSETPRNNQVAQGSEPFSDDSSLS